MKGDAKRTTITILAFALLIGALCITVWTFRSTKDNTNSFLILTDGFTDRKIVDQASALAAIGDVADTLGIEDANAEFSNCQENTVAGNTFFRFQQMHQGIPVYGCTAVVVADNNGDALSLSSNASRELMSVSLDVVLSDVEVRNIAEKNIANYIDNLEVFISPFDSSSLTIYASNGKPELAYVTEVSFYSSSDIAYYEFVVSANTGAILHCSPLRYEATGYTASDTKREHGFSVFQSQDGYFLWNTENNLYVFNLNNQESQYALKDRMGKVLHDKAGNEYIIPQWGKGEFVSSENEIFGDTNCEISKDYEAGVRLLCNTNDIAEYFKTLGFINNTKVFLYYHDGYDNGNNALGGFLRQNPENKSSEGDMPDSLIEEDIGVVSMGTNTGVDSIDMIAHEYTHFVSRGIVRWSGDNETKSINEAISDIFGELAESSITKQPVDWEIGWTEDGYRNIKSPGGNCISDYSKYEDTLKYHYASTIISHAAYLMWNGIDGSGRFKPLTAEDLANLFYETLYTLPSDCTFSEFRSLVQNMANIMHKQGSLSYEQTRTVSNAFFQVGIPPATTPVVKDDLSIDVYGTDGEPYFDYTLYVRHGSAEKTYSGEEIQAAGLTFPVLSEYELLIVDNANTDNYTSIIVNVIEKGGVKRLPIFTNCGIKKWDGTLDGYTYPPTVDEKTPAVLLSNHPYNDHNSQFALSEYEVTGEIQEKDGKYSTHTYLPDLPIIASLSGDFAHNGMITQLTIQKAKSRYDNADYITINFDAPDGGGYHYGVRVGREWDGESVYCYMLHGKDNDYLILETLIPTSSSVGTDTYYMGRTDGTRTESIQIMDLTDFSSLTYTLNYNMEHDAFTIREDDSKEGGWQYLYCQDGENYKYGSGYEQLYNSFDAAMEHVEERLSEYGLESRVEGSFSGETLSAEITPLFVAHRDGISQNYPIDSIDDMELVDVMILGVNPQLSEGTTEPPTSNSVDVFSLLGTWDSTDQEKRLHFKTTGLDIAYTKAGMINADGQVEMTDKTTGKERLASFILKSNSQIAIYLDLEEYIIDYSYDGHTLMLDGDRYVRTGKLLQDRIDGIIGTWICDDGSITFSENGTCRVKMNGSAITEGGTYSILDDNTLLINEPGRSPYEVDFVLNGDTLKVGKVSFKRSGESRGDVQSTKSAICDTWGQEESVMQYTFYNDGTYEARLSPAYSFSRVVLEDGTYEVRSSTEIYLYPDPTAAPQVIKYYPDQDTLEIFGGDFFTRCSDN